jgi:two-component system nitrogen regulation response regulator NtrX
LVVATHRNLEELAREGKFRQDLFHRVYVFPLMLPALRERREDIPALVEHFARQVCAQNGWKPLQFTPDAISALQSYAWPGNVRELRNVVERLMLLAVADRVDKKTVELALPDGAKPPISGIALSPVSGPLSERVAQFERSTILAELKRQNHHITNTAKALGLERSHLYKKCQQLGLDLRQARASEQAGS